MIQIADIGGDKREFYRPVRLCNTQHALKGQKLLAQGNARGIKAVSKAPCKVGCSKFESKIRYKKWCYFGAAKLLIFNTLIYEIVL